MKTKVSEENCIYITFVYLTQLSCVTHGLPQQKNSYNSDSNCKEDVPITNMSMTLKYPPLMYFCKFWPFPYIEAPRHQKMVGANCELHTKWSNSLNSSHSSVRVASSFLEQIWKVHNTILIIRQRVTDNGIADSNENIWCDRFFLSVLQN